MKIKPTKRFKRAYKYYYRKHYPVNKIDECVQAIYQNNIGFLKRHKDHKLFDEFRELHIDRQYNDNWLLIYSFDKESEEIVLVLVDTGTHNKLSRINQID
ncbi:type II toxin-antitoxin system mRNA interferase toxin, RelE/StbE family [Lactobacillus acetotolerans]|uniref:type II toxin-antitoxin system mRNA interferase toxin, RelE/StbE family n=1 Tax=Lactobacillus acetotolerans TaxID=1600 RepID=UPI0007BA0B9F|nr:type II toxin-antitoxin system mRNA interferase toxin, RelE/StbE family [Lactobacillus acetotolerans]QGV04708.1 type II toxin-antitoxin system mRNA interferase toxin, RelE/StbE family [Lactobacillus acetotolerans]